MTAGKYSRSQIQNVIAQADGDIDDALTLLQQQDNARPSSMFSEGVVSKHTKQNVPDQRANSKFGGIYSKKKRAAPEVSKTPKLMQAEQALTGADYFS